MKISDTAIFSIRPWVLFRATHILSSGLTRTPALFVRNIENGAHYEFKGRGGCIFLSLDGIRPVGDIVASVKNGKLRTSIISLLKQLLNENLIYNVTADPQKDIRKKDMDYFSSLINGPKIEKRSIKKDRPTHPEPEDREAILAVKKKFSKLIKAGGRLVIKRTAAPFSELNLQIFSARLSWPGIKVDNAGLGAALSAEAAATSAVGERVERMFTMGFKPDVLSQTFNELKKAGRLALDPESYKLYAPNQKILRDGEVINLKRDEKAHWTLFEESLENKKTLIPTEYASESSFPMLYVVNSNGCAAHTDPAKAKLNGVLELIERDHVLFYWRTKNTPAQIDFDTLPSHLAALIEKLKSKKDKIKLFYLKSELSTTTIQAVFLGDTSIGEPQFLQTAATRMNPLEAIEKALLELLFVLNGALRPRIFKNYLYFGENYDNSIWDFDDRPDLYGFSSTSEAYNFLLTEEAPMIEVKNLISADTGDSKKNLENLILDFHKNNIRLYFKDTTPKKLKACDFWTYKTYSPDLILLDSFHRHRTLGQTRYFTLAALLKLKNQPKTPDDLNPWPHPMA